MPIKQCAYGFSCASMMMQWDLAPEDCPNKDVCGIITKLTEEEEIELYQARLENNRRIVERIRINQEQAALCLLLNRGDTQTSESLGVTDTLAELQTAISLLESTINELDEGYIAPVGVEAHRYTVKRPYNCYEYNKLTAKDAIFEPQTKHNKVKVIHLSKDDDQRNIKGRAGIEKRNRLLAIKRQIKAATELLNEAREAVSRESIDEAVTRKIT
ncbi:hypothetical protein cce_4940 [Crocosphaera subtropica ATCC 51142]|uniref:Uncharacterized protein n=1 Tax=Crocosphaera subtropica (strain ATCC 51142 / BH68) TaxID=43989 RepID=B1X2C5_CROS5|nr:hypothetical protein [Crocosphaera subtropica]ACB54286.1 hypothetical protein cce_4940 [Crocosphaera subtropica ATCC 51142]